MTLRGPYRSLYAVRERSAGTNVRRHYHVARDELKGPLHTRDEVTADDRVILNDRAPLGRLIDRLPGTTAGVPAVLDLVPDDVILGQTELLDESLDELLALPVRHDLN